MVKHSDTITAKCLKCSAEGRTMSDEELKELIKADDNKQDLL